MEQQTKRFAGMLTSRRDPRSRTGASTRRWAASLAIATAAATVLGGCMDEELAPGADDSVVVDDAASAEVPVDDASVSAEAAARVNTSAKYLVVYNNNIENMLPTRCDEGDWNRFFTYMKAQTQSPDIFTVQQISNQAQLDALTARMSRELPGTYGGVIAIAAPGSMGYSSDCGVLKNRQTNAVIFRTDRFTNEATTRWRSDAPENWKDGEGGCRNLENTPTSQDRVENVAVRLYDRIARQRITVASIHWPTGNWHGPACADENMQEAGDAVARLGGTLQIVAGDANTTKGTRGWWSDAMADGFRDPIAETCPSSGCPDSTSTVGSRRIDFMLVKSGHGFRGARTISEAATGGRYSDHRALRANVYY